MGLLRILLAVSVYFSHIPAVRHLHLLSGDLAVELFFVVSGFYMQLILSTKYTEYRLGPAWASNFYKARYFRLLPAYTAGCLLALAAAITRPHSPLLATWTYVRGLVNSPSNVIFKIFLFTTNVTMIFQDLTLFFAAHSGNIHWSAHFGNTDAQLWQGLAVPQAWSLGIELSFYAIAPRLLKFPSRWLAILLLSCLGSKMALLLLLDLSDPWTYRFFPFELGYFIAGALAYRCQSDLLVHLPRPLGLLIVYSFSIVLVVLPLPGNGARIVCPLLLACALPLMFSMTGANKTDRLIGELSYPFYIYHLSAIAIASSLQKYYRWPLDDTVWIGLLVTFALSIVSLWLDLRFVEPWRTRFSNRFQPDLKGILPKPDGSPN